MSIKQNSLLKVIIQVESMYYKLTTDTFQTESSLELRLYNQIKKPLKAEKGVKLPRKLMKLNTNIVNIYLPTDDTRIISLMTVHLKLCD